VFPTWLTPMLKFLDYYIADWPPHKTPTRHGKREARKVAQACGMERRRGALRPPGASRWG